MNNSVSNIITHEYSVPCTFVRGEYRWQVRAEMKPDARQALNARIEARINLLETIRLILDRMNADIPLSVAARAPLAAVIFGWMGLGYSTQHLRYLLDTRLTSAYLYVDLAADGQIRADNQANADLIEMLLDAMDARESQVAA